MLCVIETPRARGMTMAVRLAITRRSPSCIDRGSRIVRDTKILPWMPLRTIRPSHHPAILLSQADTKPGCVLRSSNVVEVLQRKRGLLTNDDVETCKGGMNTWGYVGDLNDHPQLSCVYQSDDAQNEFLSNPKVRIDTHFV